MDEGLLDHVKKRVDKHPPINIINDLSKKGYEEDHVKKAINVYSKKTNVDHPKQWAVVKEITEKLGVGMSSVQFVNILITLVGGNFLIVGIFTGLKSLINVVLSQFMQEFNSIRSFKKTTIIIKAVLFSLLFLSMGFAIQYQQMWLFILLMIVTSIGIVILGDTYMAVFKRAIRAEDKGFFLSKLSHFGLFIIAAGLILGGYLLNIDKPVIMFGVTGLLFLLSSLCIVPLHNLPNNQMQTSALALAKELWNTTRSNMQKLFKNKIIITLFIASTITGVVQTLGNAYFGVFIYRSFINQALGGFLNVSLIFLVAVLTTLISPIIAKMLAKKYGTLPQLVFGTLLIALLPLAYWYTPFMLSLGMATMLGMIGASIVGLASGLLVNNELGKEEKAMYYKSFPLIITLPYIITIPLGSWLANIVGLKTFFLILALILIIGVAPSYFVLLFSAKHKVI